MFKEYQEKAVDTFKPAKALTDAQKIHAADWCLGLGGEAGEVQDLIKHHLFHEETLDKMQLAKELGDVLWYITAICETFDMSLQDVAELNIAKLSHRYNKGYNVTDSANRHAKELTFTEAPIYKVLEAKIKKTGNAPVNVICIGPDGAGKTTLLKHLSKMVDMPVHKCDYRTDDKLAEAHKLLDSQINVLYDRFYYPDDIIYGSVKGVLSPDYTEIITKLQHLNTIFIYVTAPFEVLKDRSASWKDDYVCIKELPIIVDNYRILLKRIKDAGFPVYEMVNIYDPTSLEYQNRLQSIEDFIHLHKYQYCNMLSKKGVEA